jgi:hypothetical protein
MGQWIEQPLEDLDLPGLPTGGQQVIPDSGGVWTMTDAEFKRELAKAWDEGADAECYSGTHEPLVNPYRSQPTPRVGTIPPEMLAEMDTHARQAREAVEQ